MKNLTFTAVLAFLSMAGIGQTTLTINNNTGCDYLVRLHGSSAPDTDCNECSADLCVPASSTQMLSLPSGCPAGAYITYVDVRPNHQCGAAVPCTSSTPMLTSPIGCDGYPSTLVVSNPCFPTCSNQNTRVTWVSASTIDIDP